MKLSTRSIQFLIFAVGASVALTAIFATGAEKAGFGDAEDYLLAANRILQDINSYPERGLYLPFFRPPLYPFFIASVWLVFPQSIVAVKVAQAIVFGANCVIIYRIAFVIAENSTAALFAALIFTLNPFLLMQTTDVQTETLHTFLFSAATLVLITILKAETNFRKLVPQAILSGVFFGLAALCRPSALPIALVLIFSLFLLKLKNLKLSHSFALSTSMLAGMFLTIFPWTMANYARTGEMNLINDAAGYALWAGNQPAALALYEKNFASVDEYNQYSDYVLQYSAEEKIAEWQRSENYDALSLTERESLWRREGFKNMRENPSTTAKLWFYKTWNFWKLYLNPAAYSAKAVLISAIFLGALFLMAAAGAKIVWTDYNNRQVIVLLVALFAGATVLHALTVSMIRYRIPFVDTYFCVLAGIAAAHFFGKLRNILPIRNF